MCANLFLPFHVPQAGKTLDQLSLAVHNATDGTFVVGRLEASSPTKSIGPLCFLLFPTSLIANAIG